MAALRGTVLATLAAVALLCALLFPGAIFRGEVLSQADALLAHEPWRTVAPPGFVAGNAELSDQAAQFQPWNRLLRERLAGRTLPLWNPHAGAGQPLLANLQSAVFSPFTALALLFPFGAGLLAAAVAQLLCAGLGTALLARRLRCSLPACVFAALAFTFGGFQFLWLQHPHAAVSCLLPWLLLLADLWVQAPRAWLRPAFALGVAALIVCGHIETALHVALTVAAWVALASAGRPLAARAKLVADIALWALAGAALSGAQLLPFVEYLRLSESFAVRSGFRDLWRRVPWEHWPMMAGAAALLAATLLAMRTMLRCLRDAAGARENSDVREPTGAARADAKTRVAAATGRAASASGASDRRVKVAAQCFALALCFGGVLLVALDAAGFSPFHRLLWNPDAYGSPLPGRGQPFVGPRSYVNINNGYAGLITLLLALFAVVCGPRAPGATGAAGAAGAEAARVRRGVRALGWLWLGAFVLAYELPIVSQLVNQLPLLELALNYRFTLVVGFCGALLGAVGLDALCRPETRGRPAAAFWMVGGVIAGALALSAAGRGLLASDATPMFAPLPHRWALAAGAVLLIAWGTRTAGEARGRGARLAAAALVLLGSDMVLFGRGVHPSAPASRLFPPTPVTDFLARQPEGGRVWAVTRDTLMPETAGVYGLSDLRHYDALGVERVALLTEALRSPTAPPDLDVGSALFDVLDVRFVLAPGDWSPPEASRFTRAFASGGCVVWRNERATGRAFVARSAVSIDAYVRAEESAAAYPSMPAAAARRQHTIGIARAIGAAYRAPSVADRELLIEGDAPLARLATADGGASSAQAAPTDADHGADRGADHDADRGANRASAAGGAGTVRWLLDEPEHQTLEVSAAAGGWLCVADAFFPGWTASVDGAPATIVPAFLAPRAVAVPAGTSHVEFRYEPASLRRGAWLSAAGALLVLAGAALALRPARWSGARRVRESAGTRGAPGDGPVTRGETRSGAREET